eukprot:TRINITY_DN25210_c0_g2_i1.p1 TRINITY_DN25210_c0_g2~~TRINITY_DN25210_c0_g2_i1.p1  ORF type:complete len:858 (-),score=163.63 TRINITY_DN25210_c0_g2_i1:148-2364(-)
MEPVDSPPVMMGVVDSSFHCAPGTLREAAQSSIEKTAFGTVPENAGPDVPAKHTSSEGAYSGITETNSSPISEAIVLLPAVPQNSEEDHQEGRVGANKDRENNSVGGRHASHFKLKRLATKVLGSVESVVVSSQDPSAERFPLKTEWRKTMEVEGQWVSNRCSSLSPAERRGWQPRMSLLPCTQEPLKTGRTCAIHPNSNARMIWDVVGLVLICYDLISIPIDMCFMTDFGMFGRCLDWTTLLFWTGDMCQGFLLGYFDNGVYVSDHLRILKNYILSWFIIDLLVVVPDWVVLVVQGMSGRGGSETAALEAGKIFKGARALRILRLLRLLKLRRILNALYDMIDSEWAFICTNLAKLLLSVLVMNHVIACFWFLIGRLNLEAGNPNWITKAEITNSDIAYQYTTSLHWSLTQFTPASIDVSARNSGERVFSIVVLFFALVAFGSIIGSITGFITTLRNMQNEGMRSGWLLRRYLKQRHVSKDLSNRIFKFVENQSEKSSKLVNVNKVPSLATLSEALMDELSHEMFMPSLSEHAWFDYLNKEMKVVMHRLCRNALKAQVYAEKESIFSAGDEGKRMYFIKSGVLDYVFANNKSLRPAPEVRECVSEAVLWTTWRHQGDLYCVTSVDVVTLEPQQFLAVMSIHPKPWYYSKQYAVGFLAYISELEREVLSDIVRDEAFYTDAIATVELWSQGQDTEALKVHELTSKIDEMDGEDPEDDEVRFDGTHGAGVANIRRKTLS